MNPLTLTSIRNHKPQMNIRSQSMHQHQIQHVSDKFTISNTNTTLITNKQLKEKTSTSPQQNTKTQLIVNNSSGNIDVIINQQIIITKQFLCSFINKLDQLNTCNQYVSKIKWINIYNNNQSEAKILLQRKYYKNSLKNLNNLNLKQLLFIILNVLKGTSQLFDKFGYFELTEDLICFDHLYNVVICWNIAQLFKWRKGCQQVQKNCLNETKNQLLRTFISKLFLMFKKYQQEVGVVVGVGVGQSSDDKATTTTTDINKQFYNNVYQLIEHKRIISFQIVQNFIIEFLKKNRFTEQGKGEGERKEEYNLNANNFSTTTPTPTMNLFNISKIKSHELDNSLKNNHQNLNLFFNQRKQSFTSTSSSSFLNIPPPPIQGLQFSKVKKIKRKKRNNLVVPEDMRQSNQKDISQIISLTKETQNDGTSESILFVENGNGVGGGGGGSAGGKVNNKQTLIYKSHPQPIKTNNININKYKRLSICSSANIKIQASPINQSSNVLQKNCPFNQPQDTSQPVINIIIKTQKVQNTLLNTQKVQTDINSDNLMMMLNNIQNNQKYSQLAQNPQSLQNVITTGQSSQNLTTIKQFDHIKQFSNNRINKSQCQFNEQYLLGNEIKNHNLHNHHKSIKSPRKLSQNINTNTLSQNDSYKLFQKYSNPKGLLMYCSKTSNSIIEKDSKEQNTRPSSPFQLEKLGKLNFRISQSIIQEN